MQIGHGCLCLVVLCYKTPSSDRLFKCLCVSAELFYHFKKVVRNANLQIVSYAFLGSSELGKTRSKQSC